MAMNGQTGESTAAHCSQRIFAMRPPLKVNNEHENARQHDEPVHGHHEVVALEHEPHGHVLHHHVAVLLGLGELV